MNCPVCEERMREIEKNGVNLDICPNCKGVWLDRGELEKLMEVAAGGAARPEMRSSDSGVARRDDREPEHREHDRDRHAGDERGYGERKRKGSWLGDIIGGLGGGDD